MNNIEIELDKMDFVTNMLLTTDFLKEVSDLIFSQEDNNISVKEFYLSWKKSRNLEEYFVPFNPGSLVGYMYSGILLIKEQYFDMLPDILLKDLDSSYGLDNAIINVTSNNSNLKYKYVVRRIRNALGHGNIQINIPNDITAKEELFTKTSFIFEDVDKTGTDKFEARIILDDIFVFVRKLHSIAFNIAKDKKEEYLSTKS